MPASEIRRKTFFFLTLAIIITVVLVGLPILQSWVDLSLLPRFGLTLFEGKLAVPAIDSEGKAVFLPASMMAQTSYMLGSTIAQLFKVILWMALVIAIVRFLTYIVTKTAYRNSSRGEISSLLKTVLSIVIYIVAFFIIFQSQFPDVQLAPLFTGSTIIGIVVGLALQDTLGNLFAGLALQADQPFQVGDVIMMPNRGEGVVESVSWRGVKIRTFQNKLLIISNSILGKELIEVAPKNNLNAKLVFFNTEYSASPTRTIQVVREAVRHVENVSSKIRPIVRVRNLGDNGIDWEVKYWLEDYRMQHDTDALIRQRIWYVFQREKIDFAYPTRTLHIVPEVEEAPPEEIVNTVVERLNRVSIFAPLSDEEIEKLADVSTTRIYAPGESIVSIGQEGNSMFVVMRGIVKVQIPEKTYLKTLGTLKENDFFGEMSLLTGEPRSASVVAFEEAEVLRIDKSGLKPILASNPSLVQSISELVEERRRILAEQIEANQEEEELRAKKGVMRSIRSFFGLSSQKIK